MKASACTSLVLLLLATTLAGERAAAQQVSPVRGTLVIPDAKVLPGVPFDMWIELRNTSDTSVTVGLFPHLIVRSDYGEPFEIRSTAFDSPVLLAGARTDGAHPQRVVTLFPRGRVVLTLPADDALSGNVFFRHARLSPPGHYTVSIRLDFPPGIDAEPPPPMFLGPVTTTDAVVERIQPTGADAKVWQRMQQLADRKWAVLPMTSTAIWNEILTNYTDSNYYPYALLRYPGVDDSYRKMVVAALQRFPESPVAGYLHILARDLSIRGAGMAGNAMGAFYAREVEIVRNSTRPTTRIRAFGREDLPNAPCPPEYECP